ncbi:LAFA_0G15610g1_1 [Lachancea sp. 'fantastica']|nr:LAFA_0G15610g1_1 [Lachancea sp. 'fantastica']
MASQPSEDYSEIDCPPQYRVTPNPEQQERLTNAPPLLRKKSTNYSDALELDQNLPSAMSKGLHLRKDSESEQTQQREASKHELQRRAVNPDNEDEETTYEYGNLKWNERDVPVIAASHGSKTGLVKPNVDSPPKSPYGIIYCDGEHEGAKKSEFPFERPPLKERRSSLFEDQREESDGRRAVAP